MASAILTRRNEPHWAETKVYMRKPHPNSNPNPSKADPNPNPNLASTASDHAPSDRPRQFHAPEYDEPPTAAAAVSDDSSSLNRKVVLHDRRRDSGGFVTFNISTYSKKELRELKRRLESELEQVRCLASRIESRELESSARSVGQSASGVYGGGAREVTSSAVLHHPATIGSEGFLERPAAPRTNQYYHQPPEVSKGKDKKKAFVGGRPVVSPRGTKRLAAAPESEKALAGMMSKCRQILGKLMKHKGGLWFNTPVDVVGMNLHDYHQIIKHPMDLGTVRRKLTEGLYPSPLEFAADIRLTFNNALLYNPEGHVVNGLAGQLLRLFEGDFCPAYEKYEKKQAAIAREEDERQRSSLWSRAPMPDNAMKAEPIPAISPPRLAPVPVHAPPAHAKKPQQQQLAMEGRPMMVRLPKPKAKEPNKRPMSLEEKGKLSEGLQSLPQEKMEQVLQIVRKRSGDLVQDGDEIELDFEAMDTETLWELDRFVGNCKKMMSKIKRLEAMAVNTISSPPGPASAEAGDKSPVTPGETPDATAAKRIKKGDLGDEDVDIGEEMPSANYPSVEIEKDNAGYASSSSSSDSDSSSSGSSGSDSDSSSGSDSDNGDARSPAVGLRRSP